MTNMRLIPYFLSIQFKQTNDVFFLEELCRRHSKMIQDETLPTINIVFAKWLETKKDDKRELYLKGKIGTFHYLISIIPYVEWVGIISRFMRKPTKLILGMWIVYICVYMKKEYYNGL